MFRIGLLSDTHGLLRPEAVAFLRGSDHLIHAGDLGDPEVLAGLQALAPVTVVRGNCDHGAWSGALPEAATVTLGGLAIHVLHDLAQLALDPARAGIRVVVSGHSHRPLAEERGGVLFVNPGSCGPRRFRLPVSAAELRLDGARVVVRLVDLEHPDGGPP
jgi:putative phosphoesterase